MISSQDYGVSQIDTFNARRATFIYLTCKEFQTLFKKPLKASHHISDSTFFVRKDNQDIPESDLEPIAKAIQAVIDAKKQIELVELDRNEICNYLMDIGNEEKSYYISRIEAQKIECAKLDNYLDIVYESMVTNTAELGKFRLLKYENGFLVQLTTARNPDVFARNRLSKKQFDLQIAAERQWKEIGADTITAISQYCRTTPFEAIEKWTDANSDLGLKQVHDYILSQFPEKRVIGIAGPSSSGKTTLSMPIKERLAKEGYECVTIAIDDYYQDRVNMVKLPGGGYDFEHIKSIQAPLLAERVKELLEGKTIPGRRFDFITGVGSDLDQKITLAPKGFVIIEGIHGINPELLDYLAPVQPIRVYVSPMTPMRYDDEHPISQRDICLMRRVIRDNRERGYSPRTTIGVWAAVCDGEERNICPYVGDVDCFYNSSFVYELPVIAEAGMEIFEKALQPEEGEDPDTPRARFINSEVRRIHRLLKLSGHLKTHAIRRSSGMGEFVGEDFVTDDLA